METVTVERFARFEAAVGVTPRVAVCVPPEYVAEMVTEVEAATELVLTVKVTVVAPEATVTLAGTVAAAVLLLERETTAPPAGAAALMVTVPVELAPPTTEVGLTVTDVIESVNGLTFKVAVRVFPE